MAKVLICDVCGTVMRECKAEVTMEYIQGIKKTMDLCEECAKRVEKVLRGQEGGAHK